PNGFGFSVEGVVEAGAGVPNRLVVAGFGASAGLLVPMLAKGFGAGFDSSALGAPNMLAAAGAAGAGVPNRFVEVLVGAWVPVVEPKRFVGAGAPNRGFGASAGFAGTVALPNS